MNARFRSSPWLTGVSVAGLIACGSASDAPSEGAGGGGGFQLAGASSGGSGAAAGSSAGSGGVASTMGGSSGGTSSPVHRGQVALFNLFTGNRFSMTASFVESEVPGASTCTTLTKGSCSAFTCSDAPGGGSRVNVAAGTITVSSPDATGSVTMMPTADSTYSMSTSTFDSVFGGAAHLSFKAEGGAVPAFEDTLDLPLVLLVSQPAQPVPTAGIDVDRAQSLSLAWTRGGPGILFYLQGGSMRPDGQPGRASLTCQFPTESGSGVIDSSLLSQVAPGTDLQLFTVATKNITAGEYAVTLVAANGVATADKSIIPRITLR